ncbi:MAG: hypothetical protein ACYDCQ_08815 [Dehalococcoidia bacterium]
MTVSLELSGPEASRPYIEAAKPEHPSLLDPTHTLDTLFGVVNIPNVTWIDEAGIIVRPPEPGWPGDPATLRPAILAEPRSDDPEAPRRRKLLERLGGGQDRTSYADAIRDWVANGAASGYRLDPEEVVAHSQPRSQTVSAAAAHFELGNHLWRHGQREAAIRQFNAANRLQPESGRSSATSASAASAAASPSRRSRARKPPGRSRRTSSPTSCSSTRGSITQRRWRSCGSNRAIALALPPSRYCWRTAVARCRHLFQQPTPLLGRRLYTSTVTKHR